MAGQCHTTRRQRSIPLTVVLLVVQLCTCIDAESSGDKHPFSTFIKMSLKLLGAVRPRECPLHPALLLAQA
jgi:hypothetical protein